MADRDLREADAAGKFGHRPFMGRKAVAMHEDDGADAEAFPPCPGQAGSRGSEVKRNQDIAIGGDALRHLDHAAVELFGQDDVTGEDLRARLIADTERVGKALRRDQDRGLALALQQGVGGDGGAHLHRIDPVGRDRIARRYSQQIADTLDGGIGVAFGILGQQLMGGDRSVGPPRHNVGEGAAAVDPELPAIGHDLIILLLFGYVRSGLLALVYPSDSGAPQHF
jgi:hypothetical protein